MSSAVPHNNSNHVDKILASPFYVSDYSWPYLEDNSIFPAIKDYNDSDFEANIFQQENSLVSKGGFDVTLPKNRLNHHIDNILSVPLEASANPWPCSLLQEESIVIKENTTNRKLNLFLEKQNSPLTELITDRSLPENSINSHGGNNLSIVLEASKSLCQILEEGNMSSSNKSHDTIDNFDPNIFFEQESSALEPCTYKGPQEHGFNNCNEGNLSNCFEVSVNSWQLLDQQGTSALASPSIDKRLVGDQRLIGRRKERKHKSKRLQIDQQKTLKLNEEDGSISKKQEHNAKEKMRRLMINASYLALGALLPADSRKKKKRRSAPAIIDRALEYIPELENEIEKLTTRKKNLQSKTENEQNPCQTPQLELQAPTVSIHEVVKGEVIVQITLILKDQDTVFSKLLENLEEESRSIMSASTLQVCKERVCYNLHIQMKGSSLADDYVAVLREQIMSWLS